MIGKIIKYLLLGLTSAVLSWLPVNLLGIEDAPKILGLLVVLLPSIILGAFLYIVLNYKNSKLARKPTANIVILISFCSIGWVGAMVVSAVGVDFTLSSMLQSPHELFITGLLPSITGMLFTGIGVYLCLLDSTHKCNAC